MPEHGDDGSIDSFKTYSKTPGILWKGWTMPANENLLTVYPPVDRWAARQAAIFVVVFLMLCLKGSPTIGSLVTTAAGTVSTYVLNWVVENKEPKLISAYGVTILILFLTLILLFRPVHDTAPFVFLERSLKYIGLPSATFATAVIYSTVIAFLLWCAKTRLEGKQISSGELKIGAGIALVAGVIVLFVGWLPKYWIDATLT